MWERILRWPILIMVTVALSIDFCLYLILRILVKAYEHLFCRALSRTKHGQRLYRCQTYEEYRHTAKDLDRSNPMNSLWKREPCSPHYNHVLLEQLTGQMRSLMEEGNAERMKELLGSTVLRADIGGIENALLYSQTWFGSKDAIEDFLAVTEAAICSCRSLCPSGRQQLAKLADNNFGQTALCLSGGAMLGFYHLGVVKALAEQDLLPKVICGTSAGAFMAAWLCTRSREQILHELDNPSYLAQLFRFTDDSWGTRWWRWVQSGHMLDVDDCLRKAKRVVGASATFLSAYEKTGRVLNVTVNAATLHGSPRILNYQTAPHVLIYSAMMASASIPGLLPPMQLRSLNAHGTSKVSSPVDTVCSSDPSDMVVFDELGSHWRDGSISIDIPTDLLRPLFNVQYTIVSQVNPGVVYFFYHPRGAIGEPHGHRQGQGWRGGYLASLIEVLLKLDMKRYLELLAGMDLLPKFLRLDWSLLALQRRDGTVTILPKCPTPWTMMHIVLAVPTAESLRNAIAIGEKATWPCLHMIYNRMRIERSIQSLYS